MLTPNSSRPTAEDATIGYDDRSSLISCLAHQTSRGQAISLRITEGPVRIYSHTVGGIEGLVEEFVLVLTLDK